MARCRPRWTILVPCLGIAWFGACSDSSGPSDTSIVLEFDSIPSPTNMLRPTIAGVSDPGATVTIAGPVDTVAELAGSSGSFSITVGVNSNVINEVAVLAEDSAGNQAGDTLEIAHDGKRPSTLFESPGEGSNTLSQSGFPIELAFAEDVSDAEFVSGVDPLSLWIESDRRVGGVFRRDGTFSTAFEAGDNLAPLFTTLTGSAASWLVADSAVFSPGSNRLLAHVSDRAGNQSTTRTLSFEVGADPDKLIVVNSGGAAGSSENAVEVGLANADSVAGVQFDFTYSTAVLASVDSVTAGDRSQNFDGVDFNEIAPGRVRVLLFDSGGDLMPQGQGPILTLWVSVSPSAAPGGHSLTLEMALLSEPSGGTRPLADASGTFAVP
jgi:hypothetical protein